MNKVYKLILACLLTLPTVGVHAQTGEMDTLMYHWLGLARFNGTVLVAQHGDVLLHKGYGPRDVDQDSVCNEHTIYQIGGLTEMFTAAIVYKLQEEGKLKTTDKLSKYFPDYKVGKDVTIAQLLAHRSGIYDFMDVDSFYDGSIYSPRSRADIVLAFMNRPLLFEPGTKYNLSTSDYMLLGYLIEEITGKSYFDIVRTRIFEPYGMNSTGFNFGGYPSWDKARGYQILNFTRMLPSIPVDSTVGGAAASMFSTTEDMYKWAQVILSGKFLKKQSWDAMLKPVSDTAASGWLTTSFYGNTAVGQIGEAQGYVSSFFVAPADSTVVILLSNDQESEVDYVRDGLVAILYDKPYEYPKERVIVQLYPDQLKRYEGMYEMEDGFDMNIYVENGVLNGKVTGQTPFTMYGEKGNWDHFFMLSADVTFHFTRDKRGNVDGVIVRKNRQILTGKKWQ
ncbi:MAG: serine hydrolase [Chitinophagales bacterium]|nr:serine hydrolase [Chitinophagaceae bacterium]MCB9063551.1 serine hydrolase [Chitinophagales bacterium]